MTRTRTLRGLLLGAAGTALLVAAGPARAGEPVVTQLPYGTPVGTPGPDGSMWTTTPSFGSVRGLDVARIGMDGTWLSRVSLASDDERAQGVEARGPLTPLATGGMGLVVVHRQDAGDEIAAVELARVSADGTVTATERLPGSALGASAFAIAGDGTVWWARSCADRLYRRLPGGTVRTFRLPRGGTSRCSTDVESTTALVVAPDGGAWLINQCQQRAVRVDARDRVRQWTLPRVSCDDAYGYPPAPATIALDPRGGLLYSAPNEAAPATGRLLPDGRLDTRVRWSGDGFVGADGTVWSSGGVIGPDGGRNRLRLPAGNGAANVVAGGDGTPWVFSGRRFTSDERAVRYSYVLSDDIGVAAADGAVTSWPLAPAVPAGTRGIGNERLAPDGSLWASNGSTLAYRFAPTGLPPARAPQARATRALATTTAAATVQVACGADRARFCRGSLRLGGAAKPVRFIAPGGGSAAVRLVLGERAARTLKRGGAVRTTAIVRSDGAAATRRQLTLKR